MVKAAIIASALGIGLWGAFLFSHGGLAMVLLMLKGRSRELADILRHSTGYLWNAIDFVVPGSFIFFAAWLRFRHLYFLILATLALSPILVLTAAQGNRSGLLPVFLGLASIYYLYKRRRPKTRNVLLLSFLIIVAFTFLRDFRDSGSIGRKSLRSMDFAKRPGQSLGETFAGGDDEMFDTLANMLSVVPKRVPYQPSRAVIDLAIRALPRTLYPNKPLEMNDQVIVALWPQHYQYSRAAAADSIFGNFYLYGGILAVAVGAFCTGCCSTKSGGGICGIRAI